MAEEIKVPGILRPGTGDYHSYSKDIIDDQLRNKTQSELNALFNQGKGLDENGNIVPIGGETSNADDIPYTENIPSSQHTAGSTGKKIKQLEDRIDALVPTEEPTLGETVDLSNYMMDGNVALSFTFDSDKKYVYEGRVTSMCTYARNNTSYAAFKVVDIDKYITYTISGNTFTYYGQLDSETLPNEARSKFELGRYALVKQLQGTTGDSWVDGTAGVFVDTNDRPMAFKYVPNVTINNQTINNVLLAKTANDTYIYVYRLDSGLFKFYVKVASNSTAFENLNALIIGASGANNYNDLINKPIIQKEDEGGYVFSSLNTALGDHSLAEGLYTQASGMQSHAEGRSSSALGKYSHAENRSYAIGDSTHAEGYGIAYGICSHAEGDSFIFENIVTQAYTKGSKYIYVYGIVDLYSNVQVGQDKTNIYVKNCTKQSGTNDYLLELSAGLNYNLSVNDTVGFYGMAYGQSSHVEGEGTLAQGDRSHAEGLKTLAGGLQAHAEGTYCEAIGHQSHAEGLGTRTNNMGEHAHGTYNLSTLNKTLSSIGFGGASSSRRNAFEVDINGNIYIYGIGNYNGTNISASEVKSVQTVIAELIAQLA